MIWKYEDVEIKNELPCSSAGKESALPTQETPVWFRGQNDPLEKG